MFIENICMVILILLRVTCRWLLCYNPVEYAGSRYNSNNVPLKVQIMNILCLHNLKMWLIQVL